MTDRCRLALQLAGLPYPRTCPTCGLSKTCAEGHETAQLPGGSFAVRPTRARSPACERCRFWVANTNPFGECRRRAPAPTGRGYEEQRSTAYTRASSRFPETVKTDWCGDFEPLAKGESTS